jgi:diaminohydroxyphosphoribosylaminopyrimidine deaminase/5-amino-6-(5-phosphoribosylamino)uracil reductase
LIEAGVAKVIIATRDPHPLGRGGIEALRESGISVELGPLREQADEFYQDFFDDVASAES